MRVFFKDNVTVSASRALFEINRYRRSKVIIYQFSFFYKFWAKWDAFLLNRKKERIKVLLSNLSVPFLKIIFSPHVFVGLSIFFKEYLLNFTKSLNFLVFSEDIFFGYKLYIAKCLHFAIIDEQLLKLDFFFFFFLELYLLNIPSACFKNSFFNYAYKLKLKKKQLLFRLIKSDHFFLRIRLISLFRFFRYVEHVRAMKYNEYIIGYHGFQKDIFLYLSKRMHICLYFVWPSKQESLDSAYTKGFRKALFKRLFVIWEGRRYTEVFVPYLIKLSDVNIFINNPNIYFLYLLSNSNNFRKFLYELNRKGIRNTLRFLVYSQIMKKDKKWKWFHTSWFETILDFIFFAFQKTNAPFVYRALMPLVEKKMMNWHFRQSSFFTNYILIDLEDAFNKNKNAIDLFEVDYWYRTVFFLKFILFSVTNYVSKTFIRLMGQLDFGLNYIIYYIDSFFRRYWREFFYRPMFFWVDNVVSIESEFFFGIDYFIWRIWYVNYFHEKTIESYLLNFMYDTVLFKRYISLLTVFRTIFLTDVPDPKFFPLELFSVYIMFRDLFYKNINVKLTILFYFLDFRSKFVKHKNFYLWSGETGSEFFLKIAPSIERDIELYYITDDKYNPLLRSFKMSRTAPPEIW